MKRTLLFAAFLVFAVLALHAQTSKDLQIMTEEWAPYQYLENGKPTGMHTEMVQEIMKRLGLGQKIETLPWNRALDTIDKQANKMLYTMTLTDERKPKYKWVGPLGEMITSFYALKSSGLVINSLDDARKVKLISVSSNSPTEAQLRKDNFTNLDLSTDLISMVKKLQAKRVDLILSAQLAIEQSLIKNKIPEGEIVPVFTLSKRPLYIAFSKNTPDSVIAEWQKALDDMKKDGTWKKIYNKYINM